ncbi:MAG: putative trypsin-like serine protease [Idiomarinaceae bacterium HL-53]|nr:MAG: putative trypsin-like serine protease [Idiomarinaceae bacterium HL-53]CUS49174.1 Trypsin-like peptidase domain-containing protein [Idiomarinaceae bacterium HL-53]
MKAISAFGAVIASCFLFITSSVAAQVVSYDIDKLSRAAVQLLVEDGTGSGTLLVLHNRALVLTNRHVVENFDEANIGVLVDVTEPAKPLFRAELRGFSMEYDFAYLELTHELNPDDLEADVETLTAFDIEKLRDGDYGFELPSVILNPNTELGRGASIAIFGYPGIGDNELVYTTGAIASLQYGEIGDMRLPMWYRTSAEMSSGNSGGLAVDTSGNFIGIPTSVSQEYETGGRLGNLLALPFALALMNDEEAMETDWETYREENELALDFTREPNFGAISMTAADAIAGHNVAITSGGEANTNYLGNGCVGYAAQAPDFRFTLTEAASALKVAFTASENNADTALVISAPDASWHCNDDTNGLNPEVSFEIAESGQYDVWVASYGDDNFHEGTLNIQSSQETVSTEPTPTIDEEAEFNLNGEPHFGTVALEAGFLPDPHTVTVTAGGSVNVSAQDIGNCMGYAASAPDVRLQWSGNNGPLFMYFVAATTGDDTTLVINDPNGNWYCNDDAGSGTLNPGFAFKMAPNGVYDIWIGTYTSGQWVEGTLHLSETSQQVP